MAAVDPDRGTQRTVVEEPIRAAEVVGALSLATDLGTGQPIKDGRLIDGRESFFDLHAWDAFWA